MNKRGEEETPHDVVFGRYQGTRLKKLLNDSEAKELENKGYKELAKELNVNGKKLLDAGVGPLARFSSLFSEFGADVISIDISGNILESATNALNCNEGNFVLADIMNLPFKEGIFDISFCYGTIYHMPGDRIGVEKALKELARVTKKDEIIYFNVENYLSPINWPQIVGRKILKIVGENLPPHTFFDYNTLSKMIEKNELNIIDIKTNFELWGPIIFLPISILKAILKIWMPINALLNKMSNKYSFLRFIGSEWFIKVKK